MYTTKLTNVLEWRLNDQSVASLFLWSRSSSEPVRRQRKESKHPFFSPLVFLLELVFNCYGKERCNSSLVNHVLCGLCFSAMNACGDACIDIVKLV